MISIEHPIRQDFERRLLRSQESFDSLRDTAVMKKLVELHDICSTSVYSLFHKIATCGFEQSLENFENLLSIVGNFYDDSSYGVVWEVPDALVTMRKFLRQQIKEEDKYPYIIQLFDDSDIPHLNEEQLYNIIQYYIECGIRYNNLKEKTNA